MNININELQFALFQGTQYHIDLDTGSTVSQQLIEAGICTTPTNCITLPMYSRAAVYQQYLDFLFSECHVEDVYELAKYPRFTLYDRTNDDMDMERKYLHSAFHLVEELECLQNELPDFDSFYNGITHRCAIHWCADNGFHWYEN